MLGTIVAEALDADIVGVLGIAATSLPLFSVESRATASNGSPRPTANHCNAFDFAGFRAADGL